MNSIKYIFNPKIIRIKSITFIVLILAILIMIGLTFILVNKELKKQGMKEGRK